MMTENRDSILLPHNLILLALLVFKGEFGPEIRLPNSPKFCRAQLVRTIQQLSHVFSEFVTVDHRMISVVWFEECKRALPSPTCILDTSHPSTPWRSQ